MVSASVDDPHLTRVWAALHDRLSQGRTPTQVTLHDLSYDERLAIAFLLGMGDRMPRANPYRLPVAKLRAAVGLDDDELVRLVERQVGLPVGDRAGDRAAASARKQAARDRVAAALERHRLPADEWLERRFRRIVGDVDEAADLLVRVVDSVAGFIASDVPLPVLACDAFADPHALDPGRAAHAPTLELFTALQADRTDPVRSAEQVRHAWAASGVLPDRLSTGVLTYGLVPTGDSLLARQLRDHREAHEPRLITFSELERWPVQVPAGTDVRVVENPSLIQLAASQRHTGAWVCMSGNPTTTVVLLARQLAASDANLWVHADFEPGGIAAARTLLDRVPGRPWLMSADDYIAAEPSAVAFDPHKVGDSPWDPRLADAMRRRGMVVFEEQRQVRTRLLADEL